MIIVLITHPEFGVLPGISVISFYLGGVISVIHAFLIRKEFLIRLEGQQYVKESLINKIEAEYLLDQDIPQPVQSGKTVPTTIFTRGPLTRQS